jgi:hypothetical protein
MGSGEFTKTENELKLNNLTIMITLYEAQVGDLLVNEKMYEKKIVRVDRITPERIVINNGCVYHKKNGRMVSKSDIWAINFIRIPKDGEIQEMIERDAIIKICDKVKDILDKRNITYEQAIKLKELMNL